MVIPLVRNCTTSAATGHWTKNIPGRLSPRSSAIPCCRKQLLVQQEANLASRTFSAVEKIKPPPSEYFFLTASTYPLIAASCKYHPPLPRRHGPGGRSASQLPLCSKSCPRVVRLFTHLKITWKCQVTIGSIPRRVQWGPGPNKSITDNYMYLSPPSTRRLQLRREGVI